MGYTHYFELKDKEIHQKAIDDINAILKDYDFLSFEVDQKLPPIITPTHIRFNGNTNETGHETFVIGPNIEWTFCKTNGKAYDLPVCIVLLILKYHHKDNFYLSSDGFSDNPDDYDDGWIAALEKLYFTLGYEFKRTNEGIKPL